MAERLGTHSERLKRVAALRSAKGRREQGRFALEGPTLLEEARESGFSLSEIFATQAAYDATQLVRALEAEGTPVFIVDEAASSRISDLATPTGLVAVAPARLAEVTALFAGGAPILVLADVADPANAGTLLRSAEAFGAAGVVFGSLGVEPYHPKVVRGAMGALFRLAVAVADPPEVAAAAAGAGLRLLGLEAEGRLLSEERWERPTGLVVGNERHGLGRWASLCEGLLGIPMAGRAESLSAGVAGSIALYEATLRGSCQESTRGPKSQDYRG